MKDPTNIVYFMRSRMNLSQKQISKETGLSQNDLVRMEKGNFRARIEKIKTLADYFKISLESLLFNNVKLAVQTFKEPCKISHKMANLMKSIRERCDDIGCKGEDWVYELEYEKLKDTIYINAINPNFSNCEDAHFDALSFALDGDPILIETKTTSGKEDEPFYMSFDELKRARECLENNQSYEVHRVFYIDNPKKRGRNIIPVDKLFSEYNFEPTSFRVVRKDK